MIEKFTRALFDAMMSGTGDESEFEAMGPHLELIARACLEALREPSEAMLQTGANGWREVFDEDDLRSIWQSMIDVALERKAA